MRKINLKNISEILNEDELKNVMGGSGNDDCNSLSSCGSGSTAYCDNKSCGATCEVNGRTGECRAFPNGSYYCKICWLG